MENGPDAAGHYRLLWVNARKVRPRSLNWSNVGRLAYRFVPSRLKQSFQDYQLFFIPPEFRRYSEVELLAYSACEVEEEKAARQLILDVLKDRDAIEPRLVLIASLPGSDVPDVFCYAWIDKTREGEANAKTRSADHRQKLRRRGRRRKSDS